MFRYYQYNNKKNSNKFFIDFWLLGVYYELEIEQNPFKARQLFYRALGQNKQDPSYWQEYFKFEIKYLKLIDSRNKVLNKEEEEKHQETQNQDQEDDFIALDENPFKTPQLQIKGNIDKSNEFLLTIYENSLEYCSDKEKILLSYFEAIFESRNLSSNVINQLKTVKETLFSEVRKIECSEKFLFQLFKSLYLCNMDEDSSELYLNLMKGLTQIEEFLNEFVQNIKFNKTQFFELIMQYILTNKQLFFQKLTKDEIQQIIKQFEALLYSNIEFDQLDNKQTWKCILQLHLKFDCKPTNYCLITTRLKELATKDKEFDLFYLKSLKFEDNFPKQQIESLLKKFTETFSQQEKDLKYKIYQRVLLLIEQFQIKDYDFIYNFARTFLQNFILDKIKSSNFLKKLICLIKKINFSNDQLQKLFECFISYKNCLSADCYLEYINFLLSIQNYPKTKIKLLFEKLVSYFPSQTEVWMNYIQFEKNFGNPLDCPILFSKFQYYYLMNQVGQKACLHDLTEQYNKIMFN